MPLELNGQNDIVRRNGNSPDEVVASKAKPSLTAEEVAYLEALPPQSKLKQAYLASTAKTELQGYQAAAAQVLVSGGDIPRNRAVIFGDSITNFNNATTSNAYANQSRGYMTWANILLGRRRLEVVSNLGVGSDTTTQMLARISSVLAVDAEIVIVLGGINDLAGNLSPASTVIANLQSIYDQLRASGRTVVAVSVLPVQAAHPSFSRALMSRIRAVNMWIASYCRTRRGMVLVDGFGAVVDTTSSDLVPRTNFYADATHLGTPGAYAVGKAISQSLNAVLRPLDDGAYSIGDSYLAARQTLTSLTGDGTTATATLANHRLQPSDAITIEGATPAGYNGSWTILAVPTSSTFTFSCTAATGAATGTIFVSNNGQIIDNPLFGTPSAGLASSWTITESATTTTPTTTTRSDGLGNWQQLAITASGIGSSTLQGGDHITRVFQGDTVVLEMEVEIDAGWTALEGIQLELNMIIGGVTVTTIANNRLSGSPMPTEAWSGLLRTEPLLVTGAVTRCRPKVVTYFSGAGSATVRAGRAALRKVR